MMFFRPSPAASISLLVLLIVFTRLGFWQLERAAEKAARISGFTDAGEHHGLPAQDLAGEFTRLHLRGSFVQPKHILADNQVMTGRVGVHVYTPFRLASGEIILVNRGWVPLQADRRQMPEIESIAGTLEISGRLGPMPKPGRQLGAHTPLGTDSWPQLITYPDLDLIAGALKSDLYPLVLFLDASSPGGFEGRDWKPVFMTPAKHRAYAFQWLALAVAVLFTWVLLAVRRGRGN
jgi:cytochrome oxidase assembly protein ShyY1